MKNLENTAEKITDMVGTPHSIVFHATFFLLMLISPIFKIWDISTMLLILTTAVSLEAIFLSIFIQMSVNKHSKKSHKFHTEVLKEVKNATK